MEDGAQAVSYVVRVWEYPKPRSYEETERILHDLDGLRLPNSARMQQLGALLTSRFPDPGEDDTADTAWVDSPMDGRHTGAVWNIGIVSDHLDDAYPWLVECASRLHLCVHDAQIGRNFLPEDCQWLAAFREHNENLAGKVAGSTWNSPSRSLPTSWRPCSSRQASGTWGTSSSGRSRTGGNRCATASSRRRRARRRSCWLFSACTCGR